MTRIILRASLPSISSQLLILAFAANGAVVAQTEAAGGPDLYGYSYLDSTETAGPAYSWVAIQNSGNALLLNNNGEATLPTAAASFRFYGATYTDFRVGNNGGLYVGDTVSHLSANNQQLPQVTHPPAGIFPFWDDLDDDTGDVYWQEFSVCPHPYSNLACLVVEWFDRPHSFGVGDATFEAILWENGHILFQYQDTDFGNAAYDHGNSATVGIEDDDLNPLYYLEYSFDSPIVTAPLAILFQPPEIFTDGFESGNTGSWSSASP